MAGHYEVVAYLAENGSDVNSIDSMGQTPLIYTFSRLTESTENVFENQGICFRIAQTLLSYGADVNRVSNGRSLLMDFCGISMKLDKTMLEINLSVVKFLLEHGADPYIKCELTGMNSF
jgi:ankyrin repeat protein